MASQIGGFPLFREDMNCPGAGNRLENDDSNVYDHVISIDIAYQIRVGMRIHLPDGTTIFGEKFGHLSDKYLSRLIVLSQFDCDEFRHKSAIAVRTVNRRHRRY